MYLKLIPPDATFPTQKYLLDETIDNYEFTKGSEEGQTELTVEVERTSHAEKFSGGDMFGFLTLMCTLTRRIVRFPMPAASGHALQSINQAALIGELDDPNVHLIIVKLVDTMMVEVKGQEVPMVVDGRQVTFVRKYLKVALSEAVETDNGPAFYDLHVFMDGLTVPETTDFDVEEEDVSAPRDEQ